MQDQAEIVKALRSIGDGTLNSAAKEDLERQGYQALSGRSFDGLALRVPGRVDFRKQSTLPAIIAVEQSEERARAVPLPQNGVAVITRLGSGGCWFAMPYALPANKNPLPPGKEPPPPPPLPGASDMRIQGVRVADLRGEKMPWEAGRFAVSVISAEWKTNTEIVALSDSDKSPAPGVPRKIKGRIGPGAPDALPSFVKGSNHPELKGAGAALNLPANAVPSGIQVPAFGSLRLKRDAEWPVTEDGKAAIPVTILLKRPGILYPIAINIEAPVSVSGSDEAQAWFAVDLRAAAGQPLPAGKYFVYLLAGEHLHGPSTLELSR